MKTQKSNIKAEPTSPVYVKKPEGWEPMFLTSTTYQEFGNPDGLYTTEPSETIPNETYTIRELLEKHTRGLDMNVGREPIFGEEEADFDSPDLNQIHQMDLYDVQEHLNKTKTLIEQLDKNYKSQQLLRETTQKESQIDENEVKVKQDSLEEEN